MKKYVTLLLPLPIFLLSISNMFAQEQPATLPHSRVVVTDANFASYGFEKAPNVPGKEIISIEYGPKYTIDPSFHWGSVFLTKPATVTENVRLRNSSFDKVEIENITELAYSTKTIKYNTAGDLVVPVMILQLDLNDDGKFDNAHDNSINYWPNFQIAKDPAAQKIEFDNWQRWDAFAGWWRFGDKGLIPFGTQLDLFKLADFKNFYKGKKVRIINSGGGGLRFTLTPATGFATYEGYLDDILISTTSDSRTYDFKYVKQNFVPTWVFFVGAIVLALVIFGAYRFRKTK